MIEYDTLSKQLVYATVRLECSNQKVISRGTAFFMQHNFNETNITALITNKHVVCEDEQKTIIFKNAKFILSYIDNNTKTDVNTLEIVVNDLDKRVVFHDDKNVDLCFIFVNDIIHEKLKNKPNTSYTVINTDLIIKEQDVANLNPIEDIIMIGYPIGLIDEVNNKPIVRKGITATSYNLDYNGKKEFLIDAACYHGSSGSPIFIRRTGLGQELTDKGISIGLTVNYALIGVLYAGPKNIVNGEIAIEDIPCRMTPIAKIDVMANLGCVIKPCRIMELFEKMKK